MTKPIKAVDKSSKEVVYNKTFFSFGKLHKKKQFYKNGGFYK